MICSCQSKHFAAEAQEPLNFLSYPSVPTSKQTLRSLAVYSFYNRHYLSAVNYFRIKSSMHTHNMHTYISLYKVDKNHNSLLTNEPKLNFFTLAINLLQRLHGQSLQLHNLFLLWKFLVMKNLSLLWVLFAATD